MALEPPPVPPKDEPEAEYAPTLESRPSLDAHDSESSTDPAPSVQFHEPEGPSLSRKTTESSSSSSNQLPLPASIGNKPKGSFKLLEMIPDISESSGDLEKEIVEMEFSVALDKTFVDTSSGPAARELKRRWDLQIGLTRTVRSPYAITAFVNQHGKQMFRVGRRDLSAPGANAADMEERMTLSTPSTDTSPRNSRRSRMSMNAIFNKNVAGPGLSKPAANVQGQLPRKLRKTRSIPDLVGQGSFAESSAIGRAHSKSVTGADVAPFTTIIRYDNPSCDIFADSMGWFVPPLTPGSSYSTPSQISSDQYSNGHNDYLRNQLRIPHPFGHGISYESPSHRYVAATSPPPLPLTAPVPRHLREMQSFESGLTARQEDTPVLPPKATSPRYSLDPVDLGRPLSALRLNSPGEPSSSAEGTPTTASPAPASIPEVTLVPPPDTTSVSRYSTEVFDVLQTYRGLPQIDKFSLEKGDTTFKMSLSADESAAPRDDPRFVIWGEANVDRDGDDQSISHESLTDSSIQSASISRRRLSRAKVQEVTPAPGAEGPHRILLAATIERWIAQLTSDLSYEELLDFFLTYRTYVSAVDLCHLLICRFQWSLLPHTSLHDEKVRRIVRVRTFVAIRFWILTFFTADFIPNRDLRLLFGDWLNTLIRDPILKKHTDGVGIVRKLMKVAKDCKEQHIKIPAKTRDRSSSVASKSSAVTKPHILGEQFAAAVQKTVKDDEESDVDLDFLPEEGKTADESRNILTEAPSSGFTPTRPTSLPASSQSILQHTDLAPMSTMEADTPRAYTQASSLAPPLPMQHNAISRVIVKTIGRLGRWKRVLNSRATVKPVPGNLATMSALEVEATETKGLLTVDPQGMKARPPIKPGEYSPPKSPRVVPEVPTEEPKESFDTEPTDTSRLSSTVVDTDASSTIESSYGDEEESDDRPQSFRSTSTDSFGRPLTAGGPAPLFPGARTDWGFDVVSIDDLDFSDTSSILESTPAAPPGLRKPPRKLPLRRDFEFVKRPETVSSLGIKSRDSVASDTSTASSGIALGGAVAQWQLNALVDSLSDEEETGDVEDALKRLEGQVNAQRQQEKASKVDGWVRNIQKRMAAGDYDDVPARYSDDEEDYEEDSPDHSQDGESEQKSDSASAQISLKAPSLSIPDSGEDHSEEGVDMVKTPVPTQTSHFPSSNGPAPPPKSSDTNPPPREVVPREIWQSRLPSRPSTADSAVRPSFSRLTRPPSEPRWTPSFIFTHRAAEVAEHFAMIDRDLFMAIGFEELFQDWWSPNEIEILDWEQFLRDRTRWKAEGRFPHKTSVLGAVRARFNVMANFVITEVVQAPLAHRPLLVGKFIRIAWKSYCMSSFATLVAIIAGLSSDWVTKAMRKPGWLRVGIWEKRMLKDLKLFTDSKDDFKYLRSNIAAIVDAKTSPADPTSSTANLGSSSDVPASGKGKTAAPPAPSACVPFIGVYLSQLKRVQQFPDVIDPTAPEEPIGFNALTSNLETPRHPEVFSALAPLPEGMNLEPLINVQKQRRIAGVIKSLVAAQHVASRMQFEVDKKLFQKCLKLSGLPPRDLQTALVQGFNE